jgi:hypothetical protein
LPSEGHSLKTTRSQFTSRQMMFLVAVVAAVIPLAGIALLIVGVSLLDDTYYPARKTSTYTWNAGQSPKVEVNLDEGYIKVVQSTDGRVTAVVTPFAVTKVSQAAADAALGDISISATQDGDTIRIKIAKAPKVVMSQLKADIELRVPFDASLDLLTGHGYIYIGKTWGGPNGAYPTSSPVALKAVKAKDMGQSYIGIEAEIAPRPSLPATKLDLESRHGTVVIKGDNVLIDAKAEGGAIEYAGRLAAGVHHLRTGASVPHPDAAWRLEKGIKITLPADSAFEFDASSQSGNVTSGFSDEAPATRNSLKGTVGVDPRIRLELRSGDGPIAIGKDAGETAARNGGIEGVEAKGASSP